MSPILTLYKGRVQVLEIHNLTICTMKIIILFALAAVSVCRDSDSFEPQQPKNCVYYDSSSSSSGQGQNSHSSSGQGQNSHSSSGHSSRSSSSSSSSSSHSSSSSSSSSSSVTMCDAPYNNEHANDETCMKHALEHVPELTTSLQKLFCEYNNHETDQQDEFYKKIEYELREIGRCTGCQLDDLLGTGETLGNTGDGAGGTVVDAMRTIGELLTTLGLHEPIGNLLCSLTSGLLTSECLEKITNSDISALSSNLEELFCEAEKEQMNMKLVVENMKDIGCLMDDTLDTEVLANVNEEVGGMLDPPMRELIEEVKTLPAVGGILDKVLCTVTNVVDDLRNINSDGGGLLGGGSSGSNNGGDSSGGGLLAGIGGLGR